MLGSVLSGGKALASLCTYETWDWDSIRKKSVNHKKISKPMTELTEEERGQIAGCSVCEEDQEVVRLHSLPPFKVCKKFRDRIVRAVNLAVSSGFPVYTIVGYRVGKSKGPLNSLGQNSSNH